MAAQDIWDLQSPTRALRHLILGRVLLKEDYLGGEELPVGTPIGDGGDGRSGVGMFRGQGTSVVVAQPSADGLDVEYQESAEIEAVEQWPLNLTLLAELAQDYTVERGAYVTLAPLPTAVAALRLVQQDVTLPSVDATKVRFPCIWVETREVTKDHKGGTEWLFTFLWECRYYRLRLAGEDLGDGFVDDMVQILNQAEEDGQCGGTLDQMYVRGYQREAPLDAGSGPFDIGRFSVWGQIQRTNPKALRMIAGVES